VEAAAEPNQLAAAAAASPSAATNPEDAELYAKIGLLTDEVSQIRRALRAGDLRPADPTAEDRPRVVLPPRGQLASLDPSAAKKPRSGLAGALMSKKDSHRQEAAVLVAMMGVMETSLLTLEQRIAQRIDGIEAALKPPAPPEAAAEELYTADESPALGRSASSRISGAAGAKLKTLESGLRLYEGYLGTAHPAMSQAYKSVGHAYTDVGDAVGARALQAAARKVDHGSAGAAEGPSQWCDYDERDLAATAADEPPPVEHDHAQDSTPFDHNANGGLM